MDLVDRPNRLNGVILHLDQHRARVDIVSWLNRFEICDVRGLETPPEEEAILTSGDDLVLPIGIAHH